MSTQNPLGVASNASFSTENMQSWRSGGSYTSTTIVDTESSPTNLLLTEKCAIISLDNGKVHVLDKKTMAQRSILNHEAGVWALDASGKTIISGGVDHKLRVWDTETGDCRGILIGHESTVRVARLLDEKTVISGSRDGSVRIWDLGRGTCKAVLTGHTKTVRCLSAAGDIAVSGSYDCTARVWSISKGECINTLAGHLSQIYCVAFDGTRVATGGLDTDIRIWNPLTGECVMVLRGHKSLVGNLQFREDRLISSDSAGVIHAWLPEQLEPLYRIVAHADSIISLKSDDHRIVSGSGDGEVKIWDFRTGDLVRELTANQRLVCVWHVGLESTKCYVLALENSRLIFYSWEFR